MAAVIAEVARVGRLVALIDLAIGVELCLERKVRTDREDRAELILLGEIMKRDRRIRTACALARGLSALSPSSSTQPPVPATL